MASAAKNSTPWTGRSRSTPGSRDRPGMKKPLAQGSPPLALETPPFWRYPMTTRSTALCSSERISFKGSPLTPERSATNSDLGSRVHSIPRSSRRQGAQPESSSSSPSSASAAVTLAREAQMPRFLNRSTSSAIVQRRDYPPERQAMTASLKSMLGAWISRRSSRGWPASLGDSPTKVRKVPQDSGQLPGRKGFSAILELPRRDLV
jgi:hypothetical protein